MLRESSALGESTSKGNTRTRATLVLSSIQTRESFPKGFCVGTGQIFSTIEQARMR